MKGIEIPPRFSCFRFELVGDRVVFSKLVFSYCLESAVQWLRNYLHDQGLDFHFYFKEEISLSDCHIYTNLSHQCVLDL